MLLSCLLFTTIVALQGKTVDKTKSGKVFKFKLESVGWGNRSDRNIEVDMDEWRDCLRCPAFEHCYKLCMAQMELECAIASQ